MTGFRGTSPENPRGQTRRFQNVFPCFLVLSLLILTAGCIQAGQIASPTMGSDNFSPVTAGTYLVQNVINTTPVRTGDLLPEDRMAAAIRDAMDSRDSVTRDFAVSAIPREHGGIFRISQVCDLWETVYSRWTYVEDPDGSDYYSPASRTIALGLKGDCDDFAIVVAAMIESVGGNTRIIYVTNGTAGHAYPEVFIGTTPEEFEKAAAYIRQRYQVTDIGCHITSGETGTLYWLNLDWWSGHPGGRFFADNGVRTAYYPDGRWEWVES